MMAVDQSYYTPGPTVSIPWLKQLVAYALKTMPDMLPRIIWELPLYGAKWYSSGSDWSWDGGVNYQEAVDLVKQIPDSQIDHSASNLNDPYAAHLVYTDAQGVKHTIWYHTAQNLQRIIKEFQQILRATPQFHNANLQIAVWYRATWEPTDLWRPLLSIIPN
jgi:spore germination protein YaaH